APLVDDMLAPRVERLAQFLHRHHIAANSAPSTGVLLSKDLQVHGVSITRTPSQVSHESTEFNFFRVSSRTPRKKNAETADTRRRSAWAAPRTQSQRRKDAKAQRSRVLSSRLCAFAPLRYRRQSLKNLVARAARPCFCSKNMGEPPMPRRPRNSSRLLVLLRAVASSRLPMQRDHHIVAAYADRIRRHGSSSFPRRARHCRLG